MPGLPRPTRYDPTHNYCGPEEWPIAFPRHVYGVDMNYFFYVHDKDYAIGGTEADKHDSDVKLYQSMIGAILAKYGTLHPFRYMGWRRCRKYYYAVRAGSLLRIGFNYDNSNEGE